MFLKLAGLAAAAALACADTTQEHHASLRRSQGRSLAASSNPDTYVTNIVYVNVGSDVTLECDEVASATVQLGSSLDDAAIGEGSVCSDSNELTCGENTGILPVASPVTIKCGVHPQANTYATVTFTGGTSCQASDWDDASSAILAIAYTTPGACPSAITEDLGNCTSLLDGVSQQSYCSMEDAIAAAGLPTSSADTPIPTPEPTPAVPVPTPSPTRAPTRRPTMPITPSPTMAPTPPPTTGPTDPPTPLPTAFPTISSPPTISAAPTPAPIESSSDDAVCFTGTSTVVIEGVEAPRRLDELRVGDRILTADAHGKQAFSNVVFLPHTDNQIAATFLEIRHTASTTPLSVTPSHLVASADCASAAFMGFVRADALEPEQACLLTVKGASRIESVESATRRGVYTAVPETPGALLVVDGVLASPFSYSHMLVDAYYNLHRLAYAVAPKGFAAVADAVRAAQTAVLAPLAMMIAKAFYPAANAKGGAF